MSRREEYEKQTEELLEPIVAEQGFELVDVEYVKEAGNWYLRAYIDKPGGITVDDCEVVSRRFSDVLDEKDYIEDCYIFEVSSPGLGRPLKKEKDFIRSVPFFASFSCFFKDFASFSYFALTVLISSFLSCILLFAARNVSKIPAAAPRIIPVISIFFAFRFTLAIFLLTPFVF